MKAFFKPIAIAALAVMLLGACKKQGQQQSDVTQTGQHIGNTTDSTSVDSEPGKISNN